MNLLRRFSFIVDLFFLLLVALMTYLSWGGILKQTIDGEGFYYFSPTQSLVLPNGNWNHILTGFDNFAKIATFVLERVAQGDMYYYMAFVLWGILIVNISIYVFVRFVTGNSLAALFTAVYVGLNYTGDYQFYARGHFQWFLQRVPEFVPVLFAAHYLIKFLRY